MTFREHQCQFRSVELTVRFPPFPFPPYEFGVMRTLILVRAAVGTTADEI
jgi:hypothetical protein